MLGTIKRIELGEHVNRIPQDAAAGRYYTFPTEDELVRFTAAGWRLFDREDLFEVMEGFGLPADRGFC